MPVTVRLEMNDTLVPQFRAGERAGVTKVAERVLAASDMRVPVLTEATKKRLPGQLLRSGQVSPDPGQMAAAVVHYDEFYAVWQHERLDYHHAHGQAKFLETAMADVAPEGLALIAAEVRAALGL